MVKSEYLEIMCKFCKKSLEKCEKTGNNIQEICKKTVTVTKCINYKKGKGVILNEK